MLCRLAITSADPNVFRSIYIWSGLLVGLLLVAFVGYTYLKRWMSQEEESVKVGFTLSDLRELHRQGKISDGEYEVTRNNMVQAAKLAASRMPEVLPRRPTRPSGDPDDPPTPSI